MGPWNVKINYSHLARQLYPALDPRLSRFPSSRKQCLSREWDKTVLGKRPLTLTNEIYSAVIGIINTDNFLFPIWSCQNHSNPIFAGNWHIYRHIYFFHLPYTFNINRHQFPITNFVFILGWSAYVIIHYVYECWIKKKSTVTGLRVWKLE